MLSIYKTFREMNDEVSVDICIGTLCYVAGGAEFEHLEEYLSDEMKARVKILRVPCLELCKKKDEDKTPFVRVGGKVISSATIVKVLSEIEKQM